MQARVLTHTHIHVHAYGWGWGVDLKEKLNGSKVLTEPLAEAEADLPETSHTPS